MRRDPLGDGDGLLGLQPVAGPDLADARPRGGTAGVITGGTPWRRSVNARSLPSASAKPARRARARRSSGSTTASITSSDARRSRSTSAS